MYRILSLDGGGVRGLVAARVLAELEKRTSRPTAALFDFVAGTSTGAILGLALMRPGPDGRPYWSANDLAGWYEQRSPKIFGRSVWRTVRTANGYLAPKYDPAPLEAVLEEGLGDAGFSEALCEMIVTSYNVEQRKPYFFKTAEVLLGEEPDRPMRVVARATAAPPTYLPPVKVDKRWLVDGGVFANNPAACAYAEVRKERPDVEVALISVGCGELSQSYAVPRVLRGGIGAWAQPLLDIVLDGEEEVVDYQLRHLMPKERYHRLQASLESRSRRIDDASARNLRALQAAAEQLIKVRSAEIDDVAALLVNEGEDRR